MKVAPFLLGALGVLLLLLYWSPGAGVVAGIVVLLLLPGRWWRWRTRRFRRGLRALKRGEPAAARAELEAFLGDIEGDARFDRWQPLVNLGRHYSYAGAAHSNVGVAWLHEGRPERALDHFEIARRLDEGSAQAAFGEAAARRRLGQLRRAEKAAARAVELRPRYVAARLLLAEVRRERGDRDGAEEVLRPVMEKGHDPVELTERMLAQWPDRDASSGDGTTDRGAGDRSE